MIGKHLKQEAQSAEIADLNNQLKGMMKLLEKSIGKKGVDEVWANQQIENSGTRFNEVSGSFATTNHGRSTQETSYAFNLSLLAYIFIRLFWLVFYARRHEGSLYKGKIEETNKTMAAQCLPCYPKDNFK